MSVIDSITRHYRCPSCREKLSYLFVAKLARKEVLCPHCDQAMKASPYTNWSRLLFVVAAPLVLWSLNTDLHRPTLMAMMILSAVGLFFVPVAVGPVRATNR